MSDKNIKSQLAFGLQQPFYLRAMKILAVDYGLKRCGLAQTDELQIIASGMGAVETPALEAFLGKFLAREKVELIVFGAPRYMDGSPMELEADISDFIRKFSEKYPQVRIERADERFTSKMAMQTMVDAGLRKKDRRNKELVDSISATILLQGFLQSRNTGR